MVLELVHPDKKYLPDVYEAVKEFQNDTSPYNVSSIRKMIEASSNQFETYFDDLKKDERADLKNGRVAQTSFWLVDGTKYIGSFDLRHELTENLEKIGGHIAYEIRPSMRKKGYGYKGLKLCLQKAFDMGIENVLITCKEDNIASYNLIHKVMLEYGGTEIADVQFDQFLEKRHWVHTKRRYGKIRPLAIGVIQKENMVLAYHGYDEIKKEHFYRLPGGGIEFGETSAQALKREIKEEIGLDVTIGKKLGVFENIFTFNGQQGHEIIIAYEAKLSEEYMKKEKIPMIEKEMEGEFYEFVEISPDRKIYPEILKDL